MGRSVIAPNAATGGAPHAAATERSDEITEAVKESMRASTAASDAMRAESRREVPATRTDSLDPKYAKALPARGKERPMLSSRQKKDLNKSKVTWMENQPPTRMDRARGALNDPRRLEAVNVALRSVVGRKSGLDVATRRHVAALDRSISEFEANNRREHVVYAQLNAPFDHGASREALQRRLNAMAESKGSFTFDGYIPATHSLGNVADSPEVVMEIRTRSGAYVGTSDSTPDANHIIGRGRTLRVESVQSAPFKRPDGSTGQRLVVQMTDISDQPQNA